MNAYNVLMENGTTVEVYADCAEQAEAIAESEYGIMAIWADDVHAGALEVA